MAQTATSPPRTCEAHGVETRLQCVNCGAPICLRCQVRTEVGLKCPKCAAVPEARRVGQRNTARQVAVLGAAVVVIAIIGVVLGLHFSSSSAPQPPPAVTTGHWQSLPNLSAVRGSTTAVRLQDGRVLVAGGGVGSVPLAGTEVFNSATSTWSSAGDLHQPRRGNETVLLRDGRALTAGGVAGSTVLSSVEIWSPSTGAWTTAAPLQTARFNEILMTLPDGRVLAAGGVDSTSGATLSSAEIYDPSANTWTTLSQGLLQSRADAGAVMLGGGRVLIAGGYSQQGGQSPSPLSEVEVFDPAANVFARGPSMTESRSDLTLTALTNGQVLAAGGYSVTSTLASAELYDPTTSAWSAVKGMHQQRERASASLLPDGTVLVAGGETADVRDGVTGTRTSLSTAEIYKPGAKQWLETPALHCPRSAQAQVTLTNGHAIVVGGDAAFPGQPPTPQSCAELFAP